MGRRSTRAPERFQAAGSHVQHPLNSLFQDGPKYGDRICKRDFLVKGVAVTASVEPSSPMLCQMTFVSASDATRLSLPSRGLAYLSTFHGIPALSVSDVLAASQLLGPLLAWGLRTWSFYSLRCCSGGPDGEVGWKKGGDFFLFVRANQVLLLILQKFH